VNRAARLGHCQPDGVGDPVRRRLGLDRERFLAARHRRGMVARDQHERRAVGDARRSDELRARVEHDRARRVDEVAGDRGHDAGTRLARRERHREAVSTRRLEERVIRARRRDAEQARRSGALHPVDDDVGNDSPAHRATTRSRR
jgi:hypothetical protein